MAIHKVLDSIPALHKPGMTVYTCHPSPWQKEAGGAEVQGHPWSHSKSEAILSDMRFCLKKKSTHQKRISVPRCECPKPSIEMISHSVCLILLNQNTVVSYILDLFSWCWITNSLCTSLGYIPGPWLYILFCMLLFCSVFLRGSHYVAQTRLELTM